MNRTGKKIHRIFATALIIMLMLLTLSGCDFGSKRITDIEQYGKVESYIEMPKFFPDSVEDYTVNAYAYNLESWMDTCYEIFLDITVTKEHFEELLSDKADQAKEAYYAEGYYELVFEDSYEMYEADNDEDQVVGFADIEKIVYNPKTHHIVFVSFHANDTGVYPLEDVAYFNYFDIDENEYVEHIGEK